MPQKKKKSKNILIYDKLSYICKTKCHIMKEKIFSIIVSILEKIVLDLLDNGKLDGSNGNPKNEKPPL